MSKTRFVDSNGLPDFLAFLTQQADRVLVPAEKQATAKPSIIFEPWQKGKPFVLAKATVSPKEAVLPECEPLFTFKKVQREDDPSKSEIRLTVNDDPPSTIIFACRPCDARGFDLLDKPYLQGIFVDPYYKAKREKLTIISFACNSGCETCFCHWVSGGPTSPLGSDIMMTEIEGGYVFQAVTEKGAELLAKSSFADGEDKLPQVDAARKNAWASLIPAPKIAEAPRSLAKIFADMDFWTRWTDRCISCGACTYFCPTCYCFNITDEGEAERPKGGKRLRSWDNCMSSRYTREASGHNPRPLKSQRMRNRVSHKFWTFADNWGPFLCSGCGRCITNCPVHLDIRAIVLAAIETAKNK